MKTEVEMKRKLFGVPVLQKSKSEFFSATDLVKAGNKWRRSRDMPDFNLAMWFRSKPTKEFIFDLEEEFGNVYSKGRGRISKTWVHPLLFIDLALAISPKLKIEVYKWLFDHLIKHRNASGDSYKLMSGCLYARHGNKQTFHKFIKSVALQIQKKIGVDDWQTATEKQLQQRDKLHERIANFSDALNNNIEAVRLALI